jgi:hypothetical protein
MEQTPRLAFSKMSLFREPSPPVSETQEISGEKLCGWRTRKMKQGQAHSMEDSFEKARREFFGTARTSPETGASSAEFFQPPNEIAPREVTGASSEHHEAGQAFVLAPQGLADLEL